ncbi:uncharacterized protein ARMOST_05952 [Armillaria ostoyae]|uniref:Thioesterase domain-containing protein n=2 Tax=Armillaria TaxID=47424 RepID=A0A284R1N6_ARMOS|nr:hypothetical protein ARMSODRAFT_963028 [Armillaria solidipes]SJL02620.1 uncharacterized protein ARMOST_05952 [Armillaria ostoyae]
MATSTSGSEDVSSIAGNVSDEIKRIVGFPMRIFRMTTDEGEPTGFGATFTSGMTVSEVSMVPKAEEPTKQEGRVVCKLVVTEDMINGAMTIHGGCSAYLVDICSTLAIIAYTLASGRPVNTVSQSINMMYHSPAGLGEELRIVNTTMTIGSKTLIARTEIWSDTTKRLVASGVHSKMEPSRAKL